MTDADQRLTVTRGAPGAWFILVYSNSTPQPGTFTIQADASAVLVSDTTPDRHGNAADAVLTITGAGFDATTQIELVAENSTVFTAATVEVDSFSQAIAIFSGGTVPAGTYTVRARLASGASSDLADAFVIEQGGVARLKSNLILPSSVGRHGLATIYVEYANVGSLAMPAPLLVLRGSDRALMTLDESLIVKGFWTSASPDGFSDVVQILGNGETPGVLQPGESMKVPVYYAGLLQPWNFSDNQVEFTVDVLTVDNTDAFDWEAMKSQLRPESIDGSAWDVAYANLEQQVGTTWGAYVAMLSENARYLDRLGRETNDVAALWQFEVRQATGLSVSPDLGHVIDIEVDAPGMPIQFGRQIFSTLDTRYEVGPLGFGWHWSGGWQSHLVVEPDGSVVIFDVGGNSQRYQPDSRYPNQYFSGAGDHSVLRALPAGRFELLSHDGVSRVYLSDGQIDYVEDQNGNRITATWTSARLTRLSHSAGQFLDIRYTGGGRIDLLTDSTGRTVSFSHDVGGEHLESVTGIDGQTTQYTYSIGNGAAKEHALQSIEFPDATHELFTYDANGRLESTSLDGNTEHVTYTYDATGKVFVTNDLAETTEFYFDQDSRITGFEDALGHRTLFDYDGDGNLTRTIDPLGNTIELEYDARGNVIRTVDPLRSTNEFRYATNSNQLLQATDNRQNIRTYVYDANDNLISTTYPDGSIERFIRDPNGMLDAQINRRGQSIDVLFDSEGRPQRRELPDGSFIDYQYDARGNLQMATTFDGDTLLQYTDPLNPDLATRITYPNGRFIDYSYQNGRRTSMITNEGFTVNYQYDSSGRLERLRDANNDLIVHYQYDLAGRLKRVNKGNGTFTEYQYDAVGQIEHLINHASGGAVSSRFDYVYDSLGRRTEMSMLEGTWGYEYDAAGQLVRATLTSNAPSTLPHQDLQYSYDGSGNVIQAIVNGVVVNYTVNDLDQIVAVGPDALAYDLDGNLVSRTDATGTVNYSYSSENRLVEATRSGSVVNYEYGPFDQRTATVRDGQRTEYVLDPTGLGNVVAEYDNTDNLVANYTHGLLLANQVSAAGDAAYYDIDAVGSVVGVSDDLGASLNEYRYLPYGGSLVASETVANPFQFNGAWGVMGEDNGLVYMRNRFYEPDLGTFTSSDPLRFSDRNLYRFAGNDPLQFIDPLGLAPCGVISTGDQISDIVAEAVVGLKQPIPIGTPPDNCTEEAGNGLESIDRLRRGKSGYINADRFGDPLNPGNPPRPPEPPPGVGGGGGLSGAVGSRDPNEKTGAAGFGPAGFIVPGTLLPYRVDFENMESATAPAQRVFVTDQLDGNVDWNTLEFTEAGFGDYRVKVPAGSRHFETTLDVTIEGKSFEVDLVLNLDIQSGVVTAVLQSIDPGSELPPDVLTGLLPPEDGTGRGQGFFSYIVEPLDDLTTGTEIRNIALITFDINESIATNQVDPHDPVQGTDPAKEALNTIDAGVPTSSVMPLAANTTSTSFLVEWNGTDDTGGSGVATYDVFVSDNGGPFETLVAGTTDTSVMFDGENGHTYGFYSMATDNVGHVEATPPEPDAETTIVEGPPWQNDADPRDTNDDGVVAPLDALLIINYLNRQGAGPLPVPLVPPDVPPPFYDVNGDDLISPFDALLIINFLNSRGSGEGETQYVVSPEAAIIPAIPLIANSTIAPSTERLDHVKVSPEEPFLFPDALTGFPLSETLQEGMFWAEKDTEWTHEDLEELLAELTG